MSSNKTSSIEELREAVIAKKRAYLGFKKRGDAIGSFSWISFVGAMRNLYGSKRERYELENYLNSPKEA